MLRVGTPNGQCETVGYIAIWNISAPPIGRSKIFAAYRERDEYHCR